MNASAKNTFLGYGDKEWFWISLFSNTVKILIFVGLLWGIVNTILAVKWLIQGKTVDKNRKVFKKKLKYAIIGYAIVVLMWYLTIFIGRLIFPPITTGIFG